jgi:purine nucleoside phosphorylase
VPEVIVAREEGIEVLALSLVTNMVVMPGSAGTGVKAEVERELVGAVSSTFLSILMVPAEDRSFFKRSNSGRSIS